MRLDIMFKICLCMKDKNGVARCVAKYANWNHAEKMLGMYRLWYPKKSYWLEFRLD